MPVGAAAAKLCTAARTTTNRVTSATSGTTERHHGLDQDRAAAAWGRHHYPSRSAEPGRRSQPRPSHAITRLRDVGQHRTRVAIHLWPRADDRMWWVTWAAVSGSFTTRGEPRGNQAWSSGRMTSVHDQSTMSGK